MIQLQLALQTAALARGAALDFSEAYNKLSIEEKVKLVLENITVIGSVLTGYDGWYTGPSRADVSLYDDFYWERRETKTIREIVDRAVEESDTDDIVNFILTSDNPKAQVARDFIENGLAEATYDW